MELGGIEHLSNALTLNSSVTQLNLDWLGIEDEDAKHIAQLLLVNTRIVEINLYHCSLRSLFISQT
jgi:hypothetical protein